MIQTTAKNKAGFYIGVTCPGCGSKLEIESDFFVLTCDSCRSVLKIIMPETSPAYLLKSDIPKNELRFQVDRYLKSNRLPLTRSHFEINAFYYPYWKIDAIVLKVRNKQYQKCIATDSESYEDITVTKDVTDIHLAPFTMTIAAGPEQNNIPFTIGLRTEYLKLWPFSRENMDDNFVTLPVIKSWEATTQNMDQTMFALDKLSPADFGKNITEAFHPRGSVIYFPYYRVRSDYHDLQREFIIDGVSGRVQAYATKSIIDEPYAISSSETEFGQLSIDLHRCHNCGWDLPGTQSAIYLCHNCHELNFMEESLHRLDNIYVAKSKLTSDDRLFPFWSFKISEADYKKLKPMFGGIFNSDRLIIPAFRFPNFESMYRLCKRVSSAAPKLKTIPIETMSEQYADIDLPLSEALIMADILIYREEVQRGARSGLEESNFRPVDIELFYLPFHKQSYFYVDSIFEAVTFEKNIVKK